MQRGSQQEGGQPRHLLPAQPCCPRRAAQVVGLALDSWIIVVVFFIVTSWIGFESWLLIVLAGALMLLTNLKLINLVREVTRGGHLRKLTKDAFWFGQPKIVRWMIKSTNFLLGFAIGNACYFGERLQCAGALAGPACSASQLFARHKLLADDPGAAAHPQPGSSRARPATTPRPSNRAGWSGWWS